MKGKKKGYWGILFYSGWKFWLAVIISLLANIFFPLYCWHSLPSFTSLTFNFRLCLYSFAFFCSRLLQKLCVCLFLVSNLVPSGPCFIFCFMSLIICFFIKKTIFKLFIQNINSEWVQRRAKMMIIVEERLSYADRLRELGLFRRFWRNEGSVQTL